MRLAFSKGSCDKFAVKIISKKKFSTGGKHAVVRQLSYDVVSGSGIMRCIKNDINDIHNNSHKILAFSLPKRDFKIILFLYGK